MKIPLFFVGEQKENAFDQESVINLSFFRAHYEEILAMKEQIMMIKGLIGALTETKEKIHDHKKQS